MGGVSYSRLVMVGWLKKHCVAPPLFYGAAPAGSLSGSGVVSISRGSDWPNGDPGSAWGSAGVSTSAYYYKASLII